MTIPEFVRDGLLFNAKVDLDPEGRRMTEETILAFAATWEALQLPGQICTRQECQLIGRWPEIQFQSAFLNRLANF